MCDTFYERYQHELSVYDGFIVTHTPCFAMLYERWNKPVICVASTRYEHPFSDRKEEWEDLNRYLAEKIDDGLLISLWRTTNMTRTTPNFSPGGGGR